MRGRDMSAKVRSMYHYSIPYVNLMKKTPQMHMHKHTEKGV